VVNIRVVQKREISLPDLPGFPSSPSQKPREFYSRGLGSGFVWDRDGHIVTNNHVVAGADRISVTFQDGSTVAGKVAGTDPDGDLAVVKVDSDREHLVPIEVADSTQAKVGQLVAAVGNPFGLESTMTVGFISGLGRLLPVGGSADPEAPSYNIPDIIQTDAPINPGNSGGVLVDQSARVVGVTTAIISPVGASVGIGFAIPSAVVKKVVPALIRSGRFDHPWLGIGGTSLTPDLAKAMGLKPEQRGGLVVDVMPGSPAEKAGLKGSDRQVRVDGESARVGGDVIVSLDGKPVKGFDDIVTELSRSMEVGQKVTLGTLRDGKEEQVQVTLEARPRGNQDEEEEKGDQGAVWLGIQGMTLIPEIGRAMGLPRDQRGILVQLVEQDSPADKAGLRGSFKAMILEGHRILVGGDVITALDGRPVARAEELPAFLQNATPGQEVKLSVLRDGKQLQLTLTLAKRPETNR